MSLALWKALTIASWAALCAALGAVLVTAGMGAVAGRTSWAAEAAVVGGGTGAATFAATAVFLAWRYRYRAVLAVVALFAAATGGILGIGVQNLSAMTVGVETACAVGLGRCVPTHNPNMPVLLKAGPVQSYPIVRVIIWGLSSEERAVTMAEEERAALLGQPLLRSRYGVQPATNGGAWTIPGDPQAWLRRHHRQALSPADTTNVIEQARRVRHWPDTANTQWWLATDLTAPQIGIPSPACGDHVRVPGVQGAVIRLPFGSCNLPASQSLPSPTDSCAPLSMVRSWITTPKTVEAGIDLLIVHEFAEAATDPTNGWKILVAARCQEDSLMEIADVCEPNGHFISAPAYDTVAGWQPSLLDFSRDGRAARCVNPARPDSTRELRVPPPRVAVRPKLKHP